MNRTDDDIVHSSGNVFADLGLESAGNNAPFRKKQRTLARRWKTWWKASMPCVELLATACPRWEGPAGCRPYSS